MRGRCVAHLDMDAFYVSVELRRRPELRGLPVVVAGTGPRAVVTTASYEARRYGVGSAMAAARARRLCPDGVFLPPDFAYYREASREVMAIVRSHVETVEVIGLDEAYLELTGLPAPHAAIRRVVADSATATGLSASVGIGPRTLRGRRSRDRGAQGRLGVAGAPVRHRHRRPRAVGGDPRAPHRPVVRRACLPAARRTDDRDQGQARRLLHPHPRTHAQGARQ